jgi:L-amino acid N-acyltransferase YncA
MLRKEEQKGVAFCNLRTEMIWSTLLQKLDSRSTKKGLAEAHAARRRMEKAFMTIYNEILRTMNETRDRMGDVNARWLYTYTMMRNLTKPYGNGVTKHNGGAG